jgi:hypothetical protein
MLRLSSFIATAIILATAAQAQSQTQIVNCQNSISIPSYQDVYDYDVSDTSSFTVTYTYNPQCEW